MLGCSTLGCLASGEVGREGGVCSGGGVLDIVYKRNVKKGWNVGRRDVIWDALSANPSPNSTVYYLEPSSKSPSRASVQHSIHAIRL